MKRIKASGLAIVGVCLLSVAVAAVASAQQFHVNKTGSLVGKALNTQTFTTGAGVTVECTTAASSGTATTLLTLKQLIVVKYSNCKALGFLNVDITAAQYLFNADNGEVTLDNTIVINPLGSGCTVTVLPQNLKEVKYKNNAKTLTEESNVKNIHSHGSGGLCGGLSTTGTYVGNNELELTGGSVSWS